MIRAATAVLLLVTPLLGGSAKPESALTSNSVYQQNCAKCHGKTAEGRFMAGPSLASDKWSILQTTNFATSLPMADIACRSFEEKLSAEDIDKLIFQIKARTK